ncbi:MAG: hypothetical protein WAR39_04520 [Prevotella sp.]
MRRAAHFVYLYQQAQSTAHHLNAWIDKLSEVGYIKVEKSFQ